jgi:HK97 family phage prohead protease
MKKIERRINTGREVKLEQRAAEGEGGGAAAAPVIAGVGAVCYDPADAGTEYVLWDYTYGDGGGERAVERIMPGAFDQAISRPDDVRGLFNHDANQVLGRTAAGTMKLTADAGGLSYEITPGNTTVSRDVQEHLTRKDVTGSSIAFTVDEERWTETKDASGKWNVLREILSVTLYDVGPVTFPAYESTSAGMRADGEDGENVEGGAEEAKRSLAAHRQKTRKPDVSGALAAYAARARSVAVGVDQ